jgi:ABC-type branched-subunit amino acid transport system substrate-binding protein
LRIGVTYINNDQTSATLGVSSPSTISKKSLVQALVRGINAGGGLNGRRVEAVEYEWNSQSNNWTLDASAACAKFTQDNHVAVVVDNAFGTTGGFRPCLERAGVLDIQSGPEGDTSTSIGAPLHANTFNMTVDRTYTAVLSGLSSSGYLSNSNQIGVIIEDCPENAQAYSRTLKPFMSRLGLKPPQEASIGCTTGFASAGPAASAINNAVLKFRTAGVDRVMFVSDNEAVAVLFFATSANSQGYKPGYLLSSAAQAQGLRSQVPSGQQAQFHGVGNLPFIDTDGAQPSSVDEQCRQIVNAGALSPVSYTDTSLMVFECGPFLLLQAALKSTHGNGGVTALASAIDSLGSRFAAPGVVAGATFYSQTNHDGPTMVQVFGFVPGCTCIRYSGTPQRAPQ